MCAKVVVATKRPVAPVKARMLRSGHMFVQPARSPCSTNHPLAPLTSPATGEGHGLLRHVTLLRSRRVHVFSDSLWACTQPFACYLEIQVLITAKLDAIRYLLTVQMCSVHSFTFLDYTRSSHGSWSVPPSRIEHASAWPWRRASEMDVGKIAFGSPLNFQEPCRQG